MRLKAMVFALICAAPAALASPSGGAAIFVEGNVLATFYHELGHALIDVMQLPVLGREEDAADTLSVVLTHELWDEDAAQDNAWATATHFLLTSETEPDGDAAYAGVHGLNLQRYYSTVCLFYGADPVARAAFLTEFALPPDRSASCAEEYALAAQSWGVYLDEITLDAPGDTPADTLRFRAPAEDAISALLAQEIAGLNAMFKLPAVISVELANCGEANAFYAATERKITICSEYVAYLSAQAETAGL